MERKSTEAPKTATAVVETAKGAAVVATPAKRTPATKRAAKGASAPKTPKGRTAKTPPKGASGTAKTPAKGKAKTPAKTASGSRATGPTPERIALASDVAKRRGRGEKWNEIAAATGKSEPTLAKLRKDVRAGVFANVSPAAKRVPATGDKSF